MTATDRFVFSNAGMFAGLAGGLVMLMCFVSSLILSRESGLLIIPVVMVIALVPALIMSGVVFAVLRFHARKMV